MEAQKLYYGDSHQKTFTATVTCCRETAGGFWVTLNQTAFYPEGGGQACDLGSLGGIRVLDVQERDGKVLHLCEKPLAVGASVQGEIDWQRRFDLMQQHTGEHIVSGIVHRVFGGHNVGFHMGAEEITIDFDVPIPLEALEEIEKQANRAVFENLPVFCSYPSAEELAVLPYRSKKALPWPVRIVEIPGYDVCACCGVHTKFTGEIGIIKLLSCVKFHEGVRIEMVCGERARRLFSRIYGQNRLVSQAFSAKILETGAAAEKMNQALAAEKLRGNALERRILTLLAQGYVNQKNVVHFDDALSPVAARPLAEEIARVCGGVAAVFVGSDDAGYRFCLISKQQDVSPLGRAILQQPGGKGGGKAGFFQGSVCATKKQLYRLFLESIDSCSNFPE
ncbi:MAG: alanyl-tRNA editing protein [Oscillospiraceae bacterium]|nr:alanyl-tRNA editing protein [Oscillospiraceae bacterium]